MKKYLYGLYLVALCMLCSGCGSKGMETGAEPSDTAETAGEPTEVKTSDEPTVLVYGYINTGNFYDLDSEIEEQIVKFNRSQREYVIKIKSYGEDDYATGMNSLNADIAAGKGPDIIQIDDDTQFQEYAGKGVIADLYPFLDEDEELSREQFFESALGEFEIEGKLYGAASFFGIFTTVGNPNYISTERVTFDELCTMWEENGDAIAYQPLTRERVLNLWSMEAESPFVDWENKTCDFDNEKFIDLLEFSGQFPSWNEEGSRDIFSLYQNMQANKVCMVDNGKILSFDEYIQYKSFWGQDALLIGWPTSKGCGPKRSFRYPILTINSASEQKEGAWQFVRELLQTDFLLAEDNKMKGFPILKEAFELQAQKAMEKTWGKDEEGNTIEIPKVQEMCDRTGKETIWEMYAATQEEVAYIRSVIENLEAFPDYGEIHTIVSEEAMDYWSGVKSAEDVAEVIQNRAKNYLNEIS